MHKFGHSVAVSGDKIIITSVDTVQDDINNASKIYSYDYDFSNTRIEEMTATKLEKDEVVNSKYDQFDSEYNTIRSGVVGERHDWIMDHMFNLEDRKTEILKTSEEDVYFRNKGIIFLSKLGVI